VGSEVLVAVGRWAECGVYARGSVNGTSASAEGRHDGAEG
jgi:hypothetical protein